MLIISIIVLVALVVGVYFLSRNKSQVEFTPSAPDVPTAPTVDEEAFKQSQLDALAKAQAAKAALDVTTVTANRVIADAPVAEATPTTPKKKKRYYKPKAKKQ